MRIGSAAKRIAPMLAVFVLLMLTVLLLRLRSLL